MGGATEGYLQGELCEWRKHQQRLEVVAYSAARVALMHKGAPQKQARAKGERRACLINVDAGTGGELVQQP